VIDDNASLEQVRFSGGLSLWQVLARGLGVIIALMAFVFMDRMIALTGPWAPLALILSLLLIVANALGYVELAVNSPRPGGAYRLVLAERHGGWMAFLTGWVLALSGIGICSLLARAAARYLSLLLENFLGLGIPVNLLAVGLVSLVVLWSSLIGREERGWSYTLPVLLVLLLLCLLAIPRIRSHPYPPGALQLGPAIVTVIAAFVGMEVVGIRQGEVRRQRRNIPLALLLTPLLAGALGGILAVVGYGVVGMPRTDAGMLVAVGEAIAGTIGQAGVLGLGLVILIPTLGWILALVARQLYSMSQDGFWPAWLRWAHPRRGVPTRLMLVVGLVTLPVVWVPDVLLSQVSACLYLLALVSVNLALFRRPRSATAGEPPAEDSERTGRAFALPFHPWIPGLTVAVDLLVLVLWRLEALAWAAGLLAVGALVYLLYGRSRHIEARAAISVFRPPVEEVLPEDAFKVLVPIANPATAGALLRTAGRLAQGEQGQVLALQVVVLPEPVPLEVGRARAKARWDRMEKALASAHQEGLPFQTMTRVARSVAQGILETAVEERVDMILLGWPEPIPARGGSLGVMVDAVMQEAPCDVVIIRRQKGESLKRMLVPTAGGPHARAAARLALRLAEAYQGQVTLLGVRVGPASAQQIQETHARISTTLNGLDVDYPPEQKVVLAPSVVEGILQEARDYDLVLLGVSEESLFDQFLFGSIPLQVALRVSAAALVQGYQGLTGIWRRRFLRSLRGAFPSLGKEEQLEVQQELSRGAQPGTNYFVMIVLSCVIAAMGLLLNSPAVVIGAMLVAPLMTPILAFSLGLVQGDLRLIRFSTESILTGVTVSALIAAFIGLVSPLKVVTPEMLARASPTLLDLAIALASGMAGAYAVARKDVSAALPGVAIAAALMPPLATIGLSLALGEMRVMGGAFLLFVTNIAAISLGGGSIFLLLGIRPQEWGPESRRGLRRRLVASLLLLLVIAIPLGIIMRSIVQDAAQEWVVREVLNEHLVTGDIRLVELEVEQDGEEVLVVATVQSADPFDQAVVDQVAGVLMKELEQRVQLEVVLLPVIRSVGDD
jgi:uncharacterized hydrophobic protein (TIGR00271 family)